MIVNDIFKGNTMIVKDTFGEIEIIENPNFPILINDLSHTLYKSKNEKVYLCHIVKPYEVSTCFEEFPFYPVYILRLNLKKSLQLETIFDDIMIKSQWFKRGFSIGQMVYNGIGKGFSIF